MFDDVELMEDFSFDANEDRKVKENFISNINYKIKTQYPEHIET